MIRKRWGLAALGAAFVLGAASIAVAGAVVLTGQANDLAVIKAVSSEDNVSTSSGSFVDVPGAVRRATSTGAGNLFVAEFPRKEGVPRKFRVTSGSS